MSLVSFTFGSVRAPLSLFVIEEFSLQKFCEGHVMGTDRIIGLARRMSSVLM